jgi:hypothetical protein
MITLQKTQFRKTNEALLGAPLLGRLMTLPIVIRLGWKGLPGMNALIYYEKL